MQQDVALANGAEDIGMLVQHLRQAGPERRVLQFRPVHLIWHLHQANQVDRSVDGEHLACRQAELLLQERSHCRRAVISHLQPDRITIMTVRQLALQRLAQVLDLFLVHEQLAVAGHAELVAAAHRHATEQLADVGMQDGRKENKAMLASGNVRWQCDNPRQRSWRLHDCIAGVAPERILALELNGEVQALVKNPWKRMRRVQPDRCQDWHQFGEEEFPDPLRLRRVPRGPPQEADLLLGHGRNQHVIEQAVLLIDQLPDPLVDPGIDRLRRQPSGPATGD